MYLKCDHNIDHSGKRIIANIIFVGLIAINGLTHHSNILEKITR